MAKLVPPQAAVVVVQARTTHSLTHSLTHWLSFFLSIQGDGTPFSIFIKIEEYKNRKLPK
jgi:hypothetical protein